MSRLIKERIVEQYGTKFRGVSDVAVVSVQGVGVVRMTALRSALRAKGIRAMTVHNRLGMRALTSAGVVGLDPLLKGPSTLIWGGDGIVDIAKVLADQSKTLKQLQIRGGVTAGQLLSKADFEALSKMPSRQELIGQVIGRATGAAGRVVGQVGAMGGKVVSQVRELEKKLAEAEKAAAPVAAPADGAAPAADGAAPAAAPPGA
jgi:large subunit ribosomal protein L10